jgi:hypothetical protein
MLLRCQRQERIVGNIPGGRAERLTAGPAPISTSLSPVGFVEAMSDDGSNSGISTYWALSDFTAETHHGSWTLATIELIS